MASLRALEFLREKKTKIMWSINATMADTTEIYL